jgi:hypothetical protein
MKLSSTLFTTLAFCGASSLWAGNGNAIDPTANAAVQYNVATRFGPTSLGVTCANPATYNGVSTCASQVFINVPNGFRFVITNISGGVQYNQNGSSEVLAETVNMLVNVGGTAAPVTIPFDHNQVVGSTVYYAFNKAVHIFMDASIGLETQVDAFGNIGPFFQFGTGYMNLTFQGYLVPLN